MTRYTGGCLCGAVRYSIDTETGPMRQLLCHCVDCQKHTGTAFVSGIAFASDAVTITGAMSAFTMPGGQSGDAMHRRFCSKCGSPSCLRRTGREGSSSWRARCWTESRSSNPRSASSASASAASESNNGSNSSCTT
jgi:hypothetical protein